ncbi:TPA: hypothetical protein ACJSDN_001217 [Streptococcus agalactiae]
MAYPDKSFKPTPINELIEKFDKEINQFMENQKEVISVNTQTNGLAGGFQYFVTVVIETDFEGIKEIKQADRIFKNYAVFKRLYKLS